LQRTGAKRLGHSREVANRRQNKEAARTFSISGMLL
jgi:hypothetical protein